MEFREILLMVCIVAAFTALSCSVKTYLISGILVPAVSMAVSFLFSRKIRKLDMVEILKGAE